LITGFGWVFLFGNTIPCPHSKPFGGVTTYSDGWFTPERIQSLFITEIDCDSGVRVAEGSGK